MDLPLLARAPTSPRRTTAEREPGRRTEGAPVYKQPASGNRLLKGGRHDRRTANRRGAGKGVAYLARNWKFESISLQQGVWCEPGFQHDRSAIAEAASQFQKGLDQLAHLFVCFLGQRRQIGL